MDASTIPQASAAILFWDEDAQVPQLRELPDKLLGLFAIPVQVSPVARRETLADLPYRLADRLLGLSKYIAHLVSPVRKPS